MNDHTTWETVLRSALGACSHLLILLTAIVYFRKGLTRRKSLLAGALMMAIVGFFWDLVTLSPNSFIWLIQLVVDQAGWVSIVGSLLFYVTVLLVAMDRRNQATHIAELEAILRDREERMKSR